MIFGGAVLQVPCKFINIKDNRKGEDKLANLGVAFGALRQMMLLLKHADKHMKLKSGEAKYESPLARSIGLLYQPPGCGKPRSRTRG